MLLTLTKYSKLYNKCNKCCTYKFDWQFHWRFTEKERLQVCKTCRNLVNKELKKN